LTATTDVEAVVSMLSGSFYAVYVAGGCVPPAWPERVLSQIWPS